VDVTTYHEMPKNPIVVILDNVRSMHNVGSIFRTADAFRIQKLYLCGITPAPPHRDIRKTAIGAEQSVAWEARSDILTLLHDLQEQAFQLIAIEQTDSSLLLHKWNLQSDQSYAIILGHEITGVAQQVIDLCDVAVEIPQYGTKHSLNVSVTAGIVLHHMNVQLLK